MKLGTFVLVVILIGILFMCACNMIGNYINKKNNNK